MGRKDGRPRGTYTAEVDVDIEIADVIAEVTTEELLAELKAREAEARGGAADTRPLVVVFLDLLAEQHQHHDLPALSLAGCPQCAPWRTAAGLREAAA